LIGQLEHRFTQHGKVLSQNQGVIPDMVMKMSESDVRESIETISAQWPEVNSSSDEFFLLFFVFKEYLLWKQRWLAISDRPSTFMEALNQTDERLFPPSIKY